MYKRMNWNGRRIIKNIFIYNIPERGSCFFVLEVGSASPQGSAKPFWVLGVLAGFRDSPARCEGKKKINF